VTAFIYHHPEQFSVGKVCGEGLFRRNYRLCVDTMEDFTVVSKVFEHFGDIYVSAADVVKYLDENPDIASINCQVVQKQV
jgi:spore coat polysaccharide biosynthesis protein SpsF